ncbi:MAG: PIG-L deacetylase family protein [Betaproteobacteria bacterium]
MRRLFVSPHLDDAVLSCGELIASSPAALVVTVFAGRPSRPTPRTPWDAACGFGPDDDPIAARRGEDRAALDVLGARPLWLDFVDDQYGDPRPAATIAAVLADTVAHEAPGEVYVPLGLFHADHLRASEAALAVLPQFTNLAWRAYADAIYRRIEGAVDERMHALADAGIAFTPVTPRYAAEAQARKREAVACYASQLQGLRSRRHHDDVFAREAYWQVQRAGREGSLPR